MISLTGVTKRYRATEALTRLDVTLGDAGIVAVMGRNGAGKSTLMSILAGLAAETEGSISLLGEPLRRDRRALRAATTLLPQELRLDPAVPAREMIRYLLRLRRRPDDAVADLIEVFGLTGLADRPLGTLSGGTRQRAGLVYAFAAATPVLLLDEPTQGLDPWERLRFTEHVARVAATRLIVYSTHIVSDVEAIAGRVLILEGGQLVHNGTTDDLLARAPSVWQIDADAADLAELGTHGQVSGVTRLTDGTFRVRRLGDRFSDTAKPVPPTLLDAYIAVTGGAQ
ncbi:ABC transporter ATP-binding protein [Acrocarpospora macrocephala]|uniref:ABC transporter ATP-binding protein n=1 Tax=Acrocarpospora macrocephala TaxID=150177 RepID=A0A5M3WXP4_9ACTN|nr:ATP-binding cassette domain-containing protein [Acrocarpospora macrocephala]GES13704.1 ABC transporter ATP-binding protein [Acrocarpospora macrocephala]